MPSPVAFVNTYCNTAFLCRSTLVISVSCNPVTFIDTAIHYFRVLRQAVCSTRTLLSEASIESLDHQLNNSFIQTCCIQVVHTSITHMRKVLVHLSAGHYSESYTISWPGTPRRVVICANDLEMGALAIPPPSSSSDCLRPSQTHRILFADCGDLRRDRPQELE
jgi:hypothetical protein